MNIIKTMRQDAMKIFDAGLKAVAPDLAIRSHCRIKANDLIVDQNQYPLDQFENIFIIGTGKAAAIMAKTMEQLLGDRIRDGCIIVKYGHDLPLSRIRTYQAGHPIPDENGVKGAREIRDITARAGAKDLIICLISGGGSALMPLPVEGISLTDKQASTRILLECGARIHEVNTIRKHLSQLKGGQLARMAYPSTLLTLILSDVVGDDLEVIASGPTAPDPSTFQECLDTIRRYQLSEKLPPTVIDHIHRGLTSDSMETPNPKNELFNNVSNIIIGNNRQAVVAAETQALSLGYNCLILSTLIEGETREVARVHAAIAKEAARSDHPVPKPACIISGGETTVTLRGSGKGGRNQEFALAAAMEIDHQGNIVIFSCGTDGTDGPTEAAGAISDATTILRAKEKGIDPQLFLCSNDSYHFFSELKDLVITGPTQTNVMDLIIMLVR